MSHSGVADQHVKYLLRVQRSYAQAGLFSGLLDRVGALVGTLSDASCSER